MKLLLIEITCPDIRAFGVRSLASYVKESGHSVTTLFIPPLFEQLRSKSGDVLSYPDHLLTQCKSLAEEYDLVGISFLTYYFDRAVQLTQTIKEVGKPVIWGGIHATTRPEECLQYADFVCQGEGEEALVELMDALEQDAPVSNIPNIWTKVEGKIQANHPRPLIKDIDTLPFPDYDLSTQLAYSFEQRAIVPIDERLMKFFSLAGPLSRLGTFYQYKTMASRGCPHNCAFCCNSIYREMYSKQPYLRWRSTEKIIEELELALNNIPYFNSVMFFDDSFFAMPLKRMRKFVAMYTERINLPFASQSSPQTTSREKLECLVDAGMVYLEMGIQTGSDSINSMYHRKQSTEQVLRAAKEIHRFVGKILPPDYHLILDNNWESREDILATLDLVLQLPKPFGLKPSSLVLYPGTELYQKAKQEGLIRDDTQEVYRKAFGAPKSRYLNLLILLVSYSFVPNWLIKCLRSNWLVSLLDRPVFAPIITVIRNFLTLCERAYGRLQRTIFALSPHQLGRKQAQRDNIPSFSKRETSTKQGMPIN